MVSASPSYPETPPSSSMPSAENDELFFSQTLVDFLLNTINTYDDSVQLPLQNDKSNPNVPINDSILLNSKNKEKQPVDIKDEDDEKLQAFTRLCKDAIEHVSDLNEYINLLSDRINPNVTFDMSQGHSFLELYQHVLLCYMENISFFALMKSYGLSVNNHPLMARLVEQVLILERVLTLYNKLKPRISKIATAQNTAETDLKPRIYSMVDHQNELLLSDDNKSTTESTTDVYKPPKLKAVSFEKETRHEDVHREEAPNRQTSAMMREFFEEFKQTPLEITDGKQAYNQGAGDSITTNKLKKKIALLEAQREVEEENMTRIRSKLDKKVYRELKSQQHLLSYGSSLNDLTSLANSIRSKKTTSSFNSNKTDDFTKHKRKTKHKALKK